jgi:hypothetical protein
MGNEWSEPVWSIEVLSTGKQIVVPPSLHPITGQAYRWLVPLGELPLLPEAVHVAIQRILAAATPMHRADLAPRRRVSGVHKVEGNRPGDRVNAQATWAEILEPFGWTRVGQRGEVVLWRRPGKRGSGCSATTNYGGSDRLFVFSTNGSPFAPESAYSKFAVYALLNYGGDCIAAAKALATMGYGSACPQLRTVTWRSEAHPLRTLAAKEVLGWRR